MKKFLKWLIIILLIVFVLLQFVPRPAKNQNSGPFPNDITTAYQVPDTVLQMLKTSCYDCHSDNTHYPWYSNIQPISMWLNNHIVEGKEELNFNEFASYKPKKQYHKFEEIGEVVEEGEMPLKSYTIIHKKAKLKVDQVELLTKWSKAMMDTVETRYPADLQK